ncbi:uncharacterized protein LOC119165503 [Rhipicephalus microplus]|uniref:uncharacterized protein LOC119165503 n=1 Tax=Rhipicephalus microplus TaxID=6941 RepID=UPI003F6B2B7D
MSQRRDRDKATVEVGLTLVALGSIEDELNAAKARVMSLKQRLVMNSFILTASALSPRAINRERWAYVRNERWFEDTLPLLGYGHFKQCFRVSPATFRFIVDSLRPSLERVTTNMRECIAVEKVVAIGLFKLCSVAEDRVVASVFGVGRSTVNGIYKEFCEAIVSVLESDWIKMLSPSEMAEHIREFMAVSDFPQAVGALDGCHFPVSPPQEHATDYYNYKGWYSIILLALVDHKYRFRFINVGAPGRCHDSHVYQMSSLSGMVKGPLFKAPVATIGGVAVPPLVLCDQAFPLTPNLIKPFGHNTPLSAEQKNFNYHISRVRRVVENAFGRLKARFRFTSKRMECDIANARLVIRACCVLNNICEHFSDAVQLQWLQEVKQSDSQLPQPERGSDSQIGNAVSVRSALVDHFIQRMQTQAARS